MVEIIDEKGLVIDGIDDKHFDEMIKMQIPIDAWGFRQWENLWKKIYISIFKNVYPFSKQQFNNVFSDFLYEAKDHYHLSNDEIVQYFYWISQNYLLYLKNHNMPFNFRSLKYKIGEFYERIIKSVDVRQSYSKKRIRNVEIDPKNLKKSIDLEYENNIDLLVKQLGFPIMLFYNWKFIYGEDRKSVTTLLDAVKDRCKWEKECNQSHEPYVFDILYNSIYFGPYPFEEKLNKAKFPSWRTLFSNFIEKSNVREKDWWLNCYLKREPIECVKIFSRKRKVVRRKTSHE